MQIVGLLALVLVAPTAAVVRGGNSAFLATDNGERMRPDMVAKALVNVEEEWSHDAAVFVEANSTEGTPGSFAKSCATVVSAVIQGSGGDRTVASEYMKDVCSQKILVGWHQTRCTALAAAITEHAMLADNYANRESLNPAKVCTGFWSVFVESEKEREAVEAKQREEEEKKRAEEEKKREAEEAEAKKKADEEAKAKAEEEAKAEAERQKAEKQAAVAREAEEAKARAAEAKARAAEAAAKLAEKKAEAEKVQKEAQQKLEEAQAAEKEHQERLAEHQKAEEVLNHNATEAAPVSVTQQPSANNATEAEKPAVEAAASTENATVESKPVEEANATKVEEVAVNTTAK